VSVRSGHTDGATWRSAPRPRLRLGARARGGREPSSRTDLKAGCSTAVHGGDAAVKVACP
jgi:hypothetical protein